MAETLKPVRWEARKKGRHETWMKSFPTLGIYGYIRKIDARFYSVFVAEHWSGGEDEAQMLFHGDTPTLDGAKRTVEKFAKEARERRVSNVGKRKPRAGNPAAGPKKGSPKKGNPSPKRWSVRCKTTDGNWRSVESELTKAEAAREAKIYERKGYESCVFEGRRKVK